MFDILFEQKQVALSCGKRVHPIYFFAYEWKEILVQTYSLKLDPRSKFHETCEE